MTEELTKNVGILGHRKTGIAAQREAALKNGNTALTQDVKTLTNRLGMIFDNSGSMDGTPIEDAKEGCEEFFKVCNPNDTAVALFDFSGSSANLSNDLVQLIKTTRNYKVNNFGTPLYGTLASLLKEPITRAIVFSDGQPTDVENGTSNPSGFSVFQEPNKQLAGNSVINDFIQKKIPIDTVFIGQLGDRGEKVLRDIAERTGGIFLHFQKGSTTMKNAFKYLAPKFRAMLTDGNFRKRLERGEVNK